jgi:hypothetical protein
VCVERRPEHRHVALAACPGGVPAAVPEARLMTYQQLLWPESVAVGQCWGARTIHPPVVERTNPPTPAATQFTLDRRNRTPKNFWELIQSLLYRVGCLWASGGSARHPA